MTDYDVRPADLAIVQPLRLAVVRHGLTAGDEDPAAGHFAAYRDATVIGVASIHPEPMPGSAEDGPWRLHDVGVEHGHRGIGIGAALVERCLHHATSGGASTVWCRAPIGAFGFLEQAGFARTGDPSVGGDGPEYLMFTELGPVSRSWAITRPARG